MSHHLTTFQGSVTDAIEKAVAEAVPDAKVQASGGGGHFSIVVVSKELVSKSALERQRTVLRAIAHLMKGDGAPVHAVDSIVTKAP
jgi:acid stress-induced BolA-like protein IbaG/YrbA